MRAVVCREFGHYRDMAIETVDDPTPGPGQVAIRIQATGVSFANILQIAGKHQNKAEPPFTPGAEISGIVSAIGPDVSGFAPGDRVVAAVSNGGHAEIAVARTDLTFKMPDSMSFPEGTVFPSILATSYAGVAIEGRLEAGETLLVHGAAGATGLAAVQIGRALGTVVIACASTEEKRAAALKAGADHVLPSGEFRDRVLELTGGRGADVVFDPVGGAVFRQSLRCIAPEGRLLVIGFASGDIPQVPANIALVKNIAIVGVYWGYYMGWAKLEPSPRAKRRLAECFSELFKLYEAGKIKPQVHGTLPIEKFADALAIVDERRAVGKVVMLT
ncbi:MAG: NADPH:quinone oxidoreductase family protein [Alphaproteobacteria bacterium]|nr:NADPH:quinone oxidoreductase family protein [Alphaproteobacteria bacterium]